MSLFKRKNCFVVTGCLASLLSAAGSGAVLPVQTGSPSESLQLEPGEHWSAENQAQAEEILADTLQSLAQRSSRDGFIRRDAHPKQHGCVRAQVHIDSSALAPALRVGVFAADRPTDYPAWIRFSNGNPDGANAPDIDRDIRGMALKLMNVDSAAAGSQDFVMLSSKEFFSRDGEDYLALHRAIKASGWQLGWYFVSHPRDVSIMLHGLSRAANPLQLEYFSSVPYKLGSGSMKFKVAPCASSPAAEPLPDRPSVNFLRQRLVATLRTRDACFDFMLQPNRQPEINQIENANLVWDETKSPYIKVATIRIPRQDQIDSAAQLNFCENLSFSPWHTDPATRPVGQINRIRRLIYPAVSGYRHDSNQVPQLEPRSHVICSGDSAALCRTPAH